jgi:ribosomal-protein-alanine N-acetyltransferase
LAALHAESFRAPWDQAWQADSFAEILAMPGASGLLLSAGDEPLGFVITRTVLDEMEIILLTIRPDHRQAGLGLHLAKVAIERAAAEGVHSVFLEHAAPNLAAARLYQRLGFVPVGRRRNYYHGAGADRVDAVTMKLDLPTPTASNTKA